MRTTVDIEEDVMHAIKELARREGITAGAMISTLLRKALTHTAPAASGVIEPAGTYGFRPLPAGKGGSKQIVSNDQVNKLRDEQGI